MMSEEPADSDLQAINGPRWLRRATTMVAATAFGLTVFCVGIGYFPARGTPGQLAGKWLIPDYLRSDWNWAMSELLEFDISNRNLVVHVELAGIQRRWFFKTQSDSIYRRYVLDPRIKGIDDPTWRRPLWESLAQFVRHAKSNTEAALIVRRILHQRIRIVGNASGDWRSVWINRRGSDREFEELTVAALRSIGVPARSTKSTAQFLEGQKWKAFSKVDYYVRIIRQPHPSSAPAK